MQDLEKELKEMYLKVVKKFPQIKESEITIKYPTNVIAGITLVQGKNGFHGRLDASKFFFDDYQLGFTDEEREAVIAHELGHYDYYKKNFNSRRINRIVKWNNKSHLYDEFPTFFYMVGLFSKRTRRNIKRLEKWYMMTEMYADSKAAEAGYDRQISSALEKLSYHIDDFTEWKRVKIRIKELEKILES